MNSKEFVIKQLSNLTEKFPAYTYKYWYSELDEYHYIEVVPSDFKESEAFINLEVKILNEFYEHFINESLTFSTESNLEILDEFELVQIFKLPWLLISPRQTIVKSIPALSISKDLVIPTTSYNYAYAA